MKRKAINDLKKWKDRKIRKPLIIEGARQVGKTWLMLEFGKRHFKNTAYINLDRNAKMKALFSKDMDIERIVMGLEIESGVKIDAENTLIILDEIQECRDALNSLKYFCESPVQYNIIAAGSLLGVAMHEGSSFPVGKVEFMKLYPLCFDEFLEAADEDKLVELIHTGDYGMVSVFKDKFTDYLRHYYFVGGMPEAVADFTRERDFENVRRIQKEILRSYERDFSKHIPTTSIPKVGKIWNSLPAQLARENKKFIYQDVEKGANKRGYEDAINWLLNSGLVYEVRRISKPGMPLSAYEDSSAFKLYHFDTGLLGAMSGLTAKSLIEGDRVFVEFKGALTENFVLQEMKAHGAESVYYWTSGAKAEVDFVTQLGDEIMPFEAKASMNLKAKSLHEYIRKYSPKIAVRTSLADYKQTDELYDIPLYAIGRFVANF